MSDEEWIDTDPASARAGALLELAANYDNVKAEAVRKRMLLAMDLLNEGIEKIVRPKPKQQKAALLPLRGGVD